MKFRLHRQTWLIVFATTAVLLAANIVPLRIPFIGEQEADGYMQKLGWPCAFREETRHRVFWEWHDLAIDAAVAAVLVVIAGLGAERMARQAWPFRISFRTYGLLLVLTWILLELNLHEHTTALTTVRGFPFTALAADPAGIHHNRIEPLGLLLDAAFALGVLAGALRLGTRRAQSPAAPLATKVEREAALKS